MTLFLFSLYGGIISRLHGMDLLPRWLRNLLWSVPFGAISALFYNGIFALFVAFSVILTCWLGKTTGQGNFFQPGGKDDLGDESLEFIIKWTKPYIGHGRLYNVFGMALVGFAAVAGAALAVGYQNIWAGIFICVGGLLKGSAYEIGRLIEPWATKNKIPHMTGFTNIGEFLAGFFAFIGLFFAYNATLT